MALQPSRAWVIGGLVAFLGFTAGLSAALRHVELPLILRWSIVALLIAAGGWLTLVYWRAIDEAAKEAQKWAWLWGGSAGMAVSLLLLIGAARGLFGLDAMIPPHEAPGQLMVLGAGVVVLGQVLGWLAAWALWWWRRR